MLKKISFISFIFTLSSTLFFSQNELHSSNFDEDYAVNIFYSKNSYAAPSRYSDYWSSHTFIMFDNGLEGFHSTDWKHESQAMEEASMEPPTGLTNILPDRVPKKIIYYTDGSSHIVYEDIFKLELENYNTFNFTYLFLTIGLSFEYNPRIASITENVEIKKGWIFNNYFYSYIVELSDGRTWATKKSEYQWSSEKLEQWKTGSRIIVIGNSKETCLINIELVDRRIEPKHYLKLTDRIR